MSWSYCTCRYYHLGRVVPKVDPSLSKAIKEEGLNPKKVITRRNNGLTRLPAQLELAAQARISKTADTKFRAEARSLISRIYQMRRPDDRTSLKIAKADIKTELELRDKIKNRPEYDPYGFRLTEDELGAQHELRMLIEGTLMNRTRNWQYYEYDEYSSNLYMATRLAPNYACLKTVMKEIHDLIPDFTPKSVLDFGSGMGTTTWAVNQTWPNEVSEFMNVDLAMEQHHLCDYLLRGGKDFGRPLPGIFHRQYLPASDKVRYDMVVAAFSLLELPNLELRTHMVENLWNKTNDLLVLVERGNQGGFSVIDEARSLVLKLEGHDPVDKLHLSGGARLARQITPPNAHVIAPCSHEFRCPRVLMPNKKRMDTCRFRVVYEPLELGERKFGFLKEEFSYVVLRKRPAIGHVGACGWSRWPRIVENRSQGSGHIIHKLCCPDGSLAETVITKKKYGDEAYAVAKASNWGDILPVKVCDTYRSKSSFNYEQKLSEAKSDHLDGSDNSGKY